MDLLKHDLLHEFPQYLEPMRRLRASDAHFAALVERYDTKNRTITGHEQGVGAITDEALEVLKKKRLKLKDEIYQLLRAA